MRHFHSLTLALQHSLVPAFASSPTASFLLLLAFAPNGALQLVRLATRSVFIVFFALQASSSLLGAFQASSLLLVGSSTSSILNSTVGLVLHHQTSCDFPKELESLLAPKPVDMKCAVLKVPTAGTNSWKRSHRRETAALVGPMFTPKELHYRSKTTLSIPVTVSGIHSHSKTSNWIKCTIITHVQGYQCCTEHKCKPYQYSHIQYPPNYQSFASVSFQSCRQFDRRLCLGLVWGMD